MFNGDCLIGCEGSVKLFVCVGQGELRDNSDKLDLLATLPHHKALGVTRVEDAPKANDLDGLRTDVGHLRRETEVVDGFDGLTFDVG